MADSDSNSARKSYRTSIPSRKRRDSANNARDASISRPSASGTAASRPAVSFLDGRSGQPISLSDSTEDDDDDDVVLPPRKRTIPEKLQSFEETVWNLVSPFSIKARAFLSNTKKNDNFHNHGQYWNLEGRRVFCEGVPNASRSEASSTVPDRLQEMAGS
jgi:hypothetical protein